MIRLTTTLLLILLLAPAAGEAGDAHLDFDVSLDSRPIGTHRFDILRGVDGSYSVTSVANFDVKVLGITAYRYRHEAKEYWAQACLVRIEASTNDNGRKLQVKGGAHGDRFQLEQAIPVVVRDGCVVSYAYWDPESLLRQRELLNPQTGQFDPAQVETLGEETITVRGLPVRADRYRLHGGKLIIDLWYSKSGEWLQLDSTTTSKRRLHYRLR